MKIKSIETTSLLMKLVGWGMFAFFPIAALVFPDGFLWGNHPESPHDPYSPYAFMLAAMFIALAIVLIRTANDPVKNVAIIDYTIISSLIHALVMLVQSFALPHETTHLLGDVPMLFMLAFLFWYVHPKRVSVSD